LFMDIVKYSSQSVEQQMKWKARFNAYLGEAIRDVPESERVILDTGDGAAVCFLGAPEAAMFAALHVCERFVHDETEHQPGLTVRMGVNLGPVKLVKDLNGSLNALGDGINAAQRIMSFAPENRILVSQSFYEVVSRLSDEYKALFQLKGVETDKHVREHTVYTLLPPGAEKWRPAPAVASTASTTASTAARATEEKPQKRSLALPLIGGAVAIAALVAGGLYFTRSGKNPEPPVAKEPTPTVAVTPQPKPPESKAETPAPPPEPTKSATPAKQQAAAPVSAKKTETTAPAARPDESKVSSAASNAYDQGQRLNDEGKYAEALTHFDEAIRANPSFFLAYLGRAESRRQLNEYQKSIDDCNLAMKAGPNKPRPYFCRGLGEALLKQYEPAVKDFSEALRLDPSFAPVYENRAEAYMQLQKYDLAVADFSQAIKFHPKNHLPYMRRATAYMSLKQYDKAIKDYDEVIGMQPKNIRAYFGRAEAKRMSGDRRGATEDRRCAQQLKSQ